MAKARNKTVVTDQSVTKFLHNVQDPKRRSDSLRLLSIISEITGLEPKMWGNSIVGYGTYHFKYASGREGDFMKVGFSPRKNSLTIYIMPGFDRYENLMSKLGKYSIGKSCLYIKQLEDIDIGVLKDLISESILYMHKKYGSE